MRFTITIIASLLLGTSLPAQKPDKDAARLGYLAWENWTDTATMAAEYAAAVAIAPHDAALSRGMGDGLGTD